MKPFTILVLAIFTTSCNQSGRNDSEKKSSSKDRNRFQLVGSWKWVKSFYHNQDTTFVWTNITGNLIVTEKDYSIMFIDQAEPRQPLKTLSWKNNTKEDLEKALKTFIANSGHYTNEADTLSLFREIAVWPNNMLKEKQPVKYGIDWNGDTLVLLTKNSREYWTKRD